LIRIKQFYTNLRIRTVGSHELSSIYFKQFSGTTVIKGLSIVISIIYVPLVLGFLDQEKYGIWVTLTTIVNWIKVLDIGMGGGMRNKLSEAIALKHHQKGRIYISTTYGIIGGVFILVLIVFYFVNPILDWQGILNSSIISQPELIHLTTISVTFIVLGFVLQPVTLVYLAHGDSATGGIIQLIISSVSLLFIWLASLFADKGNLILLAWIVTGIPVLVYLLVSVYTYFSKFPHFMPSFKLIKIRESGNLIRLSLQFFVSSITFMIIYGSVPFVIAHLFSPNVVTQFNIANSIFNLPIMFISLLTAPSLPLVTLAYAKKDFTWIRSMLRKLNKLSWIIVAGTTVMIVLSPFIYHIWIGDKVAIPFILSASIGIYAIINVLQIPYSTFTNGTGKIKILTILSPISIVIFITFSILLSKLFNNVIGVAMALSITCLVGLIILPIWLKKQLTAH
jgi:O-antigen/teichoic acid export membrane protein